MQFIFLHLSTHPPTQTRSCLDARSVVYAPLDFVHGVVEAGRVDDGESQLHSALLDLHVLLLNLNRLRHTLCKQTAAE